MKKIPEAQWVITYRCQMGEVANYCSLEDYSQTKEVDRYEKADVIYLLSKIGVRKLKFLGGEFFDMPEAEYIIEVTISMDLDYVITTNGINQRRILKAVKEIGIKEGSGLFFSLDFINPEHSIGGCSQPKTIAALKLIPQLKNYLPVLGVNTVVHAKNFNELPDILSWISELGGYMNVCPLIWGDWQKFIFRSRDRKYALRPQHRSQVERVMEKLVKMKEQGYHLACSKEYVLNLGKICCRNDHFDWNCGHLNRCPLIRINPDLRLMVCSDILGEKVPKFTIYDLAHPDKHEANPKKYELFQKAWLSDKERLGCVKNHGCYWSNIIRAKENFKKGGSFTE